MDKGCPRRTEKAEVLHELHEWTRIFCRKHRERKLTTEEHGFYSTAKNAKSTESFLTADEQEWNEENGFKEETEGTEEKLEDGGADQCHIQRLRFFVARLRLGLLENMRYADKVSTMRFGSRGRG